ncbi:hypothetical protein Tco_0455674, partial [Tanacetum coccineum]
MDPNLRSGPSNNNNENPDIAIIIAQQLQNIIPQIVTQVTANVNNVNGGTENGGNNGCSYKTFTACNPKEFDGKGGVIALTRWIEKMESVAFLMEELCLSNEMEKPYRLQDRFHELAKLVPHLVTPQLSRIKSMCTLTKGNEKRNEVEETIKQGSGRSDDKRAKVSKGFMATTSH